MPDNHSILNSYIPLVHFLAEVLGEKSEVVLHDVKNLDQSIVAIRNNQISGREVGGPATDLVLQTMKNNGKEQNDFITNYEGRSKNNATLRSSTYFIRNREAEIIGMLCVNTDLQPYQNLLDSVTELTRSIMSPSSGQAASEVVEHLSSSIEDLTLNSIESVINGKQIAPERMTQDEKIGIMEELNKMGIFLLKGAVSEVAKHLKASEASIYRYLKIVQK